MSDNKKKALMLWRQLFEFWDFGEEDGRQFVSTDQFHVCFFCGENYPNHSEDCVFVAAKKLIEHEGE